VYLLKNELGDNEWPEIFPLLTIGGFQFI